jgi:hypothetical protein
MAKVITPEDVQVAVDKAVAKAIKAERARIAAAVKAAITPAAE